MGTLTRPPVYLVGTVGVGDPGSRGRVDSTLGLKSLPFYDRISALDPCDDTFSILFNLKTSVWSLPGGRFQSL